MKNFWRTVIAAVLICFSVLAYWESQASEPVVASEPIQKVKKIATGPVTKVFVTFSVFVAEKEGVDNGHNSLMKFGEKTTIHPEGSLAFVAKAGGDSIFVYSCREGLLLDRDCPDNSIVSMDPEMLAKFKEKQKPFHEKWMKTQKKLKEYALAYSK